MRKACTSLGDVAAPAGVFVATASRVVSGSEHPVGTQTGDRVLDAADPLTLVPIRWPGPWFGSFPDRGRTSVHDISDPCFGGIVRGLEDSLNPFDCLLRLGSSGRGPEMAVSRPGRLLAPVGVDTTSAHGRGKPGFASQVELRRSLATTRTRVLW